MAIGSNKTIFCNLFTIFKNWVTVLWHQLMDHCYSSLLSWSTSIIWFLGEQIELSCSKDYAFRVLNDLDTFFFKFLFLTFLVFLYFPGKWFLILQTPWSSSWGTLETVFIQCYSLGSVTVVVFSRIQFYFIWCFMLLHFDRTIYFWRCILLSN